MADYKIIPGTGWNYLISSGGEIYSKLSGKHMKPRNGGARAEIWAYECGSRAHSTRDCICWNKR